MKKTLQRPTQITIASKIIVHEIIAITIQIAIDQDVIIQIANKDAIRILAQTANKNAIRALIQVSSSGIEIKEMIRIRVLRMMLLTRTLQKEIQTQVPAEDGVVVVDVSKKM